MRKAFLAVATVAAAVTAMIAYTAPVKLSVAPAKRQAAADRNALSVFHYRKLVETLAYEQVMATGNAVALKQICKYQVLAGSPLLDYWRKVCVERPKDIGNPVRDWTQCMNKSETMGDKSHGDMTGVDVDCDRFLTFGGS